MTEPPSDPMRAFQAALPPHLSRHTRTGRIYILVTRATRDHGWTIKQLVTECTRDIAGIHNPGGLITHRLEACAAGPPVATAAAAVKVPFCSPECRDNAGWILDDQGRPASRCPCRTPSEVPA